MSKDSQILKYHRDRQYLYGECRNCGLTASKHDQEDDDKCIKELFDYDTDIIEEIEL